MNYIPCPAVLLRNKILPDKQRPGGPIPSVRRHAIAVKVDIVLAEGNKVVATWEMSGTFKHDYDEIKRTGKKFNVRGVDLFKINKGKIQEDALYFDLFGLLHQIDAI
jgi:predicted ester cyclase